VSPPPTHRASLLNAIRAISPHLPSSTLPTLILTREEKDYFVLYTPTTLESLTFHPRLDESIFPQILITALISTL